MSGPSRFAQRISWKFGAGIAALLVVAVASSWVALNGLFQLESMVEQIGTREFTGSQAALKLENTLLEQRGYISLAITSAGDPSAIQELEWRRGRWKPAFDHAREVLRAPAERALLTRLEGTYNRYDTARQVAVDALRARDLTRAFEIHRDRVAPLGADAHGICEQLELLQEAQVAAVLAGAQARMQRTTVMVYVGITLSVLAALLLLWLVLRNVIRPLRALANRAEAEFPAQSGGPFEDELAAVTRGFEALVRQAASARASLAASEDRRDQAESMGKLAACIAHEVRSPLQSMSLTLHSFRSQVKTDPALLERCEFIEDEIRRIEGIVHSFLEFARPPELRRRGVEVSALLDRVLKLMGPRLKTAGIVVKLDGNGASPWIDGDPDQLQQVFVNLLSNSIDAMPAGGAIHLSCHAEGAGDGGWVVLRVRDEGCGIPEQVREHLFEPFVTTRAGGTGLGLPISANIVRRHGGAIDLEDTGAHGTAFVVRLPAFVG